MTSAPSLAVESNIGLPQVCKSGKADNDNFGKADGDNFVHLNFGIFCKNSGSTDIFHCGGQIDSTVRTVRM